MEIAAGVPPLDAETVLDSSIHTFCEDAKAKFNALADPDASRAFLAGRIERIIYRKRQVTIVGAAPLPSIAGMRSGRRHFGSQGRSTLRR
jgi:hypothetical protein